MRDPIKVGLLFVLLVAICVSASASFVDRFEKLAGQEIRVDYSADTVRSGRSDENRIRDWLLQTCLFLLEVPVDSMLVHSLGQIPLGEESTRPFCALQNGRSRWAWVDDDPLDSEAGHLVVLIPTTAAADETGLLVDEFRAMTGCSPHDVYTFVYNLTSPTEALVRSGERLPGNSFLDSTSTSTGYAETVISSVSDFGRHLDSTSRLTHVRIEDDKLVVAGRKTNERGITISIDDIATLASSYDGGQKPVFSLDWRGCETWDQILLIENALDLATVNDVALSPCENQGIIARRDGVGQLFEIDNPEAGIILDQGSPVLAVAWSANGALVATSGADGRACIWRASDGELLSSLEHSDWVRSLAFSPDGTTLATACDDGAARIWRIEDTATQLQLPHDDWVRSVAFSPDGSLLATGSDDGLARVWRTTDGGLVSTLEHPDWVRTVAFSLDGSRVITGCDDGAVRIWDFTHGEVRHELRCPSSEWDWTGEAQFVLDVAATGDGKEVAAVDLDGRVHVWHLPSERYVADLEHERGVTCLASSSDGETLLTGSATGHVKTWDMPGLVLRSDRWIWDEHLDEDEWLNALADAFLLDDPQPLYTLARYLPPLERLLSTYCCQCARYEGSLAGTAAGMTWFYCDLTAKLWALDWEDAAPRELGLLPVLDQPISYRVLEQLRALPSTRIWFEPRYVDWSRRGDSLYFGRHGARIFAASTANYGVEAAATPIMGSFISWWEKHWEEIEETDPEFGRLGEMLKWSTVIAWLADRGRLDTLDSLRNVSPESNWRFAEWLEMKECAWSSELSLLEPDLNETECIPILASDLTDIGHGMPQRLSGGVSGCDWSVARTSIAQNEDLLSEIARILTDAEGSLRSQSGTLARFSDLSPGGGTVTLSVPDGLRLRTAYSEMLTVEGLVGQVSGDLRSGLRYQLSVQPIASPNLPFAEIVFTSRMTPTGPHVQIQASPSDHLEITSIARELAASAVPLEESLAARPDLQDTRQLPDGDHLASHVSLGWLRIAAEPCAGRFTIVGESTVDEQTVFITPLTDAEATCWQWLADGKDPDSVVAQLQRELGNEEYERMINSLILPYLDRAGIPYTAASGIARIVSETGRSDAYFLDVPTDPVHRMLLTAALSEQGPPIAWVADGSTIEATRNVWEGGSMSLEHRTSVFVSMGSEASESVRGTSSRHCTGLQEYCDTNGLNLEFKDLTSLSTEEAATLVRKALQDPDRNVLIFAHRLDWKSLEAGSGDGLNAEWVVDAAAGDGSRRLVVFAGCHSHVFGLGDLLVGSGTTSFTLSSTKLMEPSRLFEQLGDLAAEIKRLVEDGETELRVPDLIKILSDLDIVAVEPVAQRDC